MTFPVSDTVSIPQAFTTRTVQHRAPERSPRAAAQQAGFAFDRLQEKISRSSVWHDEIVNKSAYH
jgi:hypothetical protein